MPILTLIKSLGLNVALLISLTAIYRQTLARTHTIRGHHLSMLNGCLFGIVGVVGMLVPVQVIPGVILDGRVLVVALAGAFTGGLSAAIAGAFVSLYRLYLGGIGAWAGVGAVVVGALLGTLFYRRYRQSLGVKHLLILGITLAIQGLLWVLALPTDLQVSSFLSFWLPVGIAYPVGTVFLGLLLLNEQRQNRLEHTLQENEKHLALQLLEQEALLNISHAISEMKQPADLKRVALAILSALQDLNINAQSIAIHRIQDAKQNLIRTLRVASNNVISNLVHYQASPEFMHVWTSKQIWHRPNIQKSHPQNFEALTKRFGGLPIHCNVDVPFLQGVLCMHSTHIDAFSESDIQVLQKIAEMLSVGMARVEDLEHLEQRTEELEKEITERKRVEEELVRTQRLRAVGELSAGISHNLNNILTGILGPAMLLELKDLSPDARVEVAQILKAGNRAKDLVRRLHSATRGAQQDIIQGADLNTIVNEAIQLTQPRWKDEAESKGILIQINQNLSPVPTINGTPAGLLDIIINIIFNATDALPNGGDINIRTKEKDNKVLLTVQDTGIGMDAETQARIFEPFFTTKANIGTGLGMATAYNSIQKWGGTIDVTSQPQKGTTFHITFLPLQNPDSTN